MTKAWVIIIGLHISGHGILFGWEGSAVPHEGSRYETEKQCLKAVEELLTDHPDAEAYCAETMVRWMK